MDTPRSHLTHDELDNPHGMACDCACACENLHVPQGSAQHLGPLEGCDDVINVCDMHTPEVPEAAQRVAAGAHYHLD